MPYIGFTMYKPVRNFVLFLPLLVAAAGFSQTETQITPEYAEEIEVRVIDIDVVVTDRRGNPLTELAREDFELYENGRRVDILYFSRIAGGRLADFPGPSGEEAGADGFPQQERIPRTWVIFIDHTNMTPPIRNHAMRQLQLFLHRAIARGDRGMVALNDGRSFRIRQPATDDQRLLMQTLAKMEKERMSISPTKMRANVVLNQMRRSEEEMGATASVPPFVSRDETEFMAQTAGGEIEALIEEESSRTKAAILALGALLDSLAPMEGRLALVYVGAGFNTLPVADLAAVWRTRYPAFTQMAYQPRPEEQRDAIQREITRLYDNLSALRVTVYTIHGGDASGGPTSVEDAGQMDTSIESSTDIVQRTEAGTAREMAQRTGGLYFRVNPALAGQLQAVVRDFDDYYSLGYRPEGKPGNTRLIRVKVNADGARVRHRESVRERTVAEKAAGAVVASMVQPQPSAGRRVRRIEPVIPTRVATDANPLGVSVNAERPKRLGSGEHFLSFNFSLQLEALTFVERSSGHRAAFVMHFALVGRDGTVYPLESREQVLTLPASELPSGSDQLVAYSWHLDVVPLHIPEGVPARQRGMRLNVMVEDRYSGTRSIITVPLGEP